MGLQATKDAYEIAKDLYISIKKDFETIENEDPDNEEFMMDNALENIAKLNRAVNKINLEDFEDAYPENFKNLKTNVRGFKEAGYYIERSISSMKLFDKVNPVMAHYLNDVEWKNIGATIDEASSVLSNYLSDEENYKQYRTIIQNIIKGTLTKKSFETLFNSVSPRLPKPAKENKPKQRHPLPPEMWPEKERKAHDAQLQKRKDAGVPDTKQEFDIMGEGFISLELYKKLKG